MDVKEGMIDDSEKTLVKNAVLTSLTYVLHRLFIILLYIFHCRRHLLVSNIEDRNVTYAYQSDKSLMWHTAELILINLIGLAYISSC